MHTRSFSTFGSLACALGFFPSAATADFIEANWAARTGEGDWFDPLSWDVGQVPDNRDGNSYAVSFNSLSTVNLDGKDINPVVTDFQSTGGMKLNTKSIPTLTVLGELNQVSGVFELGDTQLILEEGSSALITGGLTLSAQGKIVNRGTLSIGARLLTLNIGLATNEPDIVNAAGGTVRLNIAGNNEDKNNFITHNAGTFIVAQDQLESTKTFLQAEATGVVRVHEGAVLKSADLSLVAGLVQGAGLYDGTGGKGISFGDGTTGAMVDPGLGTGDAAELTFQGNVGEMGGAMLHFDIHGTEPGAGHDHLLVYNLDQNSMDLTGVILEIVLGYVPGADDYFDIITSDMPILGFFENEENGRVSFVQGSFAVVRSEQKGKSVIRLEDFALVPEPSAWVEAAGLGLLAFSGWRHSRRTRPS